MLDCCLSFYFSVLGDQETKDSFLSNTFVCVLWLLLQHKLWISRSCIHTCNLWAVISGMAPISQPREAWRKTIPTLRVLPRPSHSMSSRSNSSTSSSRLWRCGRMRRMVITFTDFLLNSLCSCSKHRWCMFIITFLSNHNHDLKFSFHSDPSKWFCGRVYS